MEMKDTKRIILYFMYDKDGIVDDYVIYMLKSLKKVAGEILVVFNGSVSQSGRQKFENIGVGLLERENEGFDVWAYKTGIDYYGFEKLAEYDELIMMNHTIMGPIFPIEEMFSAMEEKELDFWGITKFHEYSAGDPFGTICYGYIPEHIQSHFIAVRRNMIQSKEFQDYWNQMPPINNYLEAVGFHEAIFTKKFADMGYRWDVYSDLGDFSHNPIICAPRELFEETRCPIFKRRSFMQDYKNVIDETYGQATVEMYRFIEEQTDYNTELIWDNILRLENLAIIKKNMQFNFVLPRNQSEPIDEIVENKRIALVMHIYYEDQAQMCLKYACSMPEQTDVYITTDTDEKVEMIRKVFEDMPCGKLEVCRRNNVGRDLSTLIVEFREEIKQYDYVCYAHDKKVKQLEPRTIGYGFAYKCFENVLASKDYVRNVLNLFEKNKRLGMVAPPPPNHGEYYFIIGQEWGMNYEVTKELAKKLGLNVPISENFEPISALGSMFWFRPKALHKLLDYPWTYEELPQEPVAEDGTVLHAVERIHGYAAQSAGYYSGYVMCDTSAAVEMTNLDYMVRTLNRTLFSHGCAAGRLCGVDENLYNSLESLRKQDRLLAALGLQRQSFPRRVYRKVRGAGGKVKRGIKRVIRRS